MAANATSRTPNYRVGGDEEQAALDRVDEVPVAVPTVVTVEVGGDPLPVDFIVSSIDVEHQPLGRAKRHL